jgi:NOL1/NOP2/fmu family ribosome biogenesis protein
MPKLLVLNTREIKRINELLKKEFSYSLKSKHVYLQNDKNKIFLVNKDISKLDLDKIRVDRMGLYFAELKNSQLRLSKEGAQLLAREAQENDCKLDNVIELDQNEIKEYFKGLDLEKDLGEENRLVLLKYNSDIFGCAKYKDGKILNFLSKIHRGEVII